MAKNKLFLTAYERQKRIEAAMKRQGMTWNALAVKMGRGQTPVQRALAVRNGKATDPRLSTIKAAARALGVSAGFLIDRKVKR